MSLSQLDRRPAFLDGGTKQLWIGGRWVDPDSDETFESIDPSTGQVLARLPRGNTVDVGRAVHAARAAFEGPWSQFRPADRQRVILRLADLIEERVEDFARIDSMDMGMPVKNARALLGRVTGNLRYAASRAMSLHGATIPNSSAEDIFSYTLREPVGVVGAIVPWNGPMFQSGWKLGPVLATGCTVVLKPSEMASLGPLLWGEISVEAGIPDGVINVVTGDGTAGAELSAHLDVDKITFTGSTETGRRIVQASAGNIKRLTLELGGKSANIVFPDADLDAAVPSAAWTGFVNSGQACSAGTRLYVHRDIFEEFTTRVGEFANSLTVGHGLDPATDLGPIVSARQFDRVNSYLESGFADGARALSGGSRLQDGDLGSGYFVGPTTFVDVEDSMRVASEEIFGPVISALPFDDVDDVVARANNSPYGLAGYLWTRDSNRIQEITRRLQAGTVYVNSLPLIDPAVPFGGYKLSGYGRESGNEHYDAFLNTKAVYTRFN